MRFCLIFLVILCFSCKVNRGYVLPSSPSVTYTYKEDFSTILKVNEITPKTLVSIENKLQNHAPVFAPLPLIKKKTIKKRLFRSWAKRKLEDKERRKLFPKKKKTFGDYFNSKIKIGLVFLLIAVATALIPVKTVPVIFGIASVLYLAWGLRKAFR